MTEQEIANVLKREGERARAFLEAAEMISTVASAKRATQEALERKEAVEERVAERTAELNKLKATVEERKAYYSREVQRISEETNREIALWRQRLEDERKGIIAAKKELETGLAQARVESESAMELMRAERAQLEKQIKELRQEVNKLSAKMKEVAEV